MTFPKRKNGGINPPPGPGVVPVALARAVFGSGGSVPVVPAALSPGCEPPNEEISGPSPTMEGEDRRFAPRNPVGNVWTQSMIHYKAEGVNGEEEGTQIDAEASSSERGEHTHHRRQVDLDTSVPAASASELAEDMHYSIPKRSVWMCLGFLFLVVVVAATVGVTMAISKAYGSASDEYPFPTTPSTGGSEFPAMRPSSIPSGFPSMLPPVATIADKADLLAAIDSWVSSGGTDVTCGLTINDWDVSRVDDFSCIFDGRETFNDPISDWQTSQVTDMEGMFRGASTFNQPLNDWDVSNVSNMGSIGEGMFYKASSFDQPLNNWDVASVTSMRDLFREAASFNQDISDWDTSSLIDTRAMFLGANSFNNPLGDWDVSRVHHFEFMFAQATSFNQNIINWDVGSATDMNNMFQSSGFNQDINGWNVGSVTSMGNMFNSALFNQNLGEWDVSKVVTFECMFCGSSSAFNQDISNWSVASATNMLNMFRENSNFNQDLCAWGSHLFGSGVAVTQMFDAGTTCPSQSDPNLETTPVTPLCHPC